jgi:Tol biopolymer transport system component
MQLRRDRRIHLPLLGALGLVIGLLIAAVLTAPRIQSYLPLNESSQVPASASISITFSQRMDPESVEDHLQIDPAIDAAITWSENTLVLEHDDSWPQGATVTVTVSSGARSAGFLPLLRSVTWSFTIGEPRIAFLWEGTEYTEVYAQELDSDEPEKLTETEMGVYDFSLGGRGTLLVYSAERQDGGTDLYMLDLVSGEDRLVYPCPSGSRCESSSLSPSGDYLTFERVELQTGVAGQMFSGNREVWILPLDGEQQPFLAGEQDHATSAPRWSPMSTLTFYDSTIVAIVIIDPRLGPNHVPLVTIPCGMGNLSTWSPDGTELVFAEMVISADQEPVGESETDHDDLALDFYTHLFVIDLSTNIIRDLSGDERLPVEDASPAYSPDGQSIAFARRYMDEALFTLGRQIWLMEPDGSIPRTLTGDTLFNHSSLAWSPDSSTLAYMRFNRADISQEAEIWTVSADGQNARKLFGGGYLPVWIP